MKKTPFRQCFVLPPIGIAFGLACSLMSGCDDSHSVNDVIFGPEPLKQISAEGHSFRQLAEEDRIMLVGYLVAQDLERVAGRNAPPATGRTVAEVLRDARAWRAALNSAEVEREKRAAEVSREAEELRNRVNEEQRQLAERVSRDVVVSITGKNVLPEDASINRYSELLIIQYAIQSKAGKPIIQIKGKVIFRDAVGDMIGELPFNMNERIDAAHTITTTTGVGYKLNRFTRGQIEEIASRNFANMSAVFVPESIAYEGGEVVKVGGGNY